MLLSIDNRSMASPFFSGRIPQPLYDAVIRHCEQTGESKTDVLTKALSTYINFPLADKSSEAGGFSGDLKSLEKRVVFLEQALATLQSLQNRDGNAAETTEQVPQGQMSLDDIQPVPDEPFSEDLNNHKFDNNSDNNTDNGFAINNTSTLTHQQVAEETGLKLERVRTRHLRKSMITREGVCYRPTGSKGKPRWLKELD